MEISGKKATEIFENESGGHRFQRSPPTEKRGRIQTSTITVAVLPQPTEAQIIINDRDLEYSACRGSGAGGQHRNVTDSAIQLKHIPSGIMVRCEAERSQHLNKETALSLLRARLWEAKQQSITGARAEDRKNQIGSGQRGDKTWTIRVKDDVVTHHPSGKQFSYKNYMRGIYEV